MGIRKLISVLIETRKMGFEAIRENPSKNDFVSIHLKTLKRQKL
jgi:hypothetical protein